MSVLSSLQKLLVKMGGQPSVGDNTDETLDKIADLYSGGSAPMYVTISRSLVEEEYVYTADKTVNEMIEQIEAGGQLFYNCWNSLTGLVSRYQVTEEVKGVGFTDTRAYPTKVETWNVSILNTGSGDEIRVQKITYSNS